MPAVIGLDRYLIHKKRCLRPIESEGYRSMRGPDIKGAYRITFLILLLIVVAAIFRFALAADAYRMITPSRPIFFYNAAVLGFNYFQLGFLRRGLAGSIAYLLGPNLLAATFLFHTFCAVWIAALGTWIIIR